MTSLTAYTALESLLLFQSLAAYGVGPAAFSKISDLLKNYPYIRDAKGYDGGRLSPDALRELYLRLLKEAESQEALPSAEGRNGDLQARSRKRKAPSPSPTTVQDASRHAHLLPRLVSMLYARYREQATTEIRDDERKYLSLQREVEEIGRGEWDDKLRRQQSLNGRGADRSLTATPVSIAQRPSPIPETESHLQTADTPEDNVSRLVEAPKDDQPPPNPRSDALKIESVISHTPPPSFNGSQLAPTTTYLPSASTAQIISPTVQSSAPDRTFSQHEPPTPTLPIPQPSGPGYRLHPSPVHQSPYNVPQPSLPTLPLPLPASQPPTVAFQLPPTSATVPQPVGIARAGAIPISTLANYSAPHPNPAAVASARYPPTTLSHHPGSVPNGGYGPAPVPAYPVAPRSQYPRQAALQPQSTPSYLSQRPHVSSPSQRGGYMLPPFQITLPDSNRTPQPRENLQQPSALSEPREKPELIPSDPVTPIQARGAPGTYAPNDPPARPTTAKIVPRSSLSHVTPTSATRWKNIETPVFNAGRSLPRPRSVSPISDHEPTPPPSSPKSTVQGLDETGRSRKALEDDVEADTRQTRSGRRPIKRPRAGSGHSTTPTSTARARTRSQSVTSHLNATPADSESSMGKVKAEPSTPADITSEPVLAEGRTGLRRREPVRPHQHLRRKNAAVEGHVEKSPMHDHRSTTDDSKPHTQPVVTALRNFARISAPVMNDILSHKHASLFSLPVKEKDVEGYSDIIRRPTDLKSIRAAISAGTRAVNAATMTETPAGASPASAAGGSAASVTLPATPELVPPRGIVNAAQLERELMRMFANAVMFNTGDDGVVGDTREMFEAVQRAVSSWRSVERTAAEARGRKGDDGPGADEVDEDVAPAASKRRKL